MHNVALFRCEDCEIFFKSKKGYEGHLANKHAPKLIGSDGLAKSKKEVEGLNKVKDIPKTCFEPGHYHRKLFVQSQVC